MADPKREQPGASPTLLGVTSEQLRCPDGHVLPYHTTYGDCTPLFCAKPPKEAGAATEAELASNIPMRGRAKKAAVSLARATPADVRDQGQLEKRRVELAATREKARTDYLGTPRGLTGAEAEAFADRKLVELLPLAAAELEFQLRFGDDRARELAAREVLDRTGRGKKEIGTASGPLMIINVGEGGVGLPWLKRDKTSAVAAEVKAVVPGDLK